MILSDLRDEVRLRCRITSSTSDPLATDLNITHVLNAAARRIWLEEPNGWPWYFSDETFPTVAGTERYNYVILGTSPPVAKVQELRLGWPSTDRVPLPRLQRAQQRTAFPSQTPGIPASYAVRGGWIYLAPIPNDVYTMYAEILRAELTMIGDTDVLLLPTRFTDVLVEKAAELLFRRMGNLNEATAARGEYNDLLKGMRASKREFRGPGTINVTLDDQAF